MFWELTVSPLKRVRGSLPRSLAHMNKRKLYKYWHRTKVLARKRNRILEAHDNSRQAFELPEIKAIDAQTDYWEARTMRLLRRKKGND